MKITKTRTSKVVLTLDEYNALKEKSYELKNAQNKILELRAHINFLDVRIEGLKETIVKLNERN